MSQVLEGAPAASRPSPSARPTPMPGGSTRRSDSPRLPGRPKPTIGRFDLKLAGAVEKTRTSTRFRPLRPQRCASASSATTAPVARARRAPRSCHRPCWRYAKPAPSKRSGGSPGSAQRAEMGQISRQSTRRLPPAMPGRARVGQGPEWRVSASPKTCLAAIQARWRTRWRPSRPSPEAAPERGSGCPMRGGLARCSTPATASRPSADPRKLLDPHSIPVHQTDAGKPARPRSWPRPAERLGDAGTAPARPGTCGATSMSAGGMGDPGRSPSWGPRHEAAGGPGRDLGRPGGRPGGQDRRPGSAGTAASRSPITAWRVNVDPDLRALRRASSPCYSNEQASVRRHLAQGPRLA